MVRKKPERNTGHHRAANNYFIITERKKKKRQFVLRVARKHAYAWRSMLNSCLIQSFFKHHLFIQKVAIFVLGITYVCTPLRIIFLFPYGKSIGFQKTGILCYKMYPQESTNLFKNQLALSKECVFSNFRPTNSNDSPMSKQTVQNCSVPCRGNTLRMFI